MKRLVWAVGLSVLIHTGMIYWYHSPLFTSRPATLPRTLAIQTISLPPASTAEQTTPRRRPLLPPAQPEVHEPESSVPLPVPVPPPPPKPKPTPEKPPKPAPNPHPPLPRDPGERPPVPPEHIPIEPPVDTVKAAPAVTPNQTEATTDQTKETAAAPAIVEAQPRYRLNPKPPYPAAARKRNQQGTVLLLVVVDKAGDVKEIEIIGSSGYPQLDRAAVNGVRQWRFEAGRKGSEPIESTVQIPVRFELH